jgi:hypothetical protein
MNNFNRRTSSSIFYWDKKTSSFDEVAKNRERKVSPTALLKQK